MREIFKFWGYSPQAWLDVSGPGGPLVDAPPVSGPLETLFGRVRLTDEALDLVPELAAGMAPGFAAFIRRPAGAGPEPSARPVAWLEPHGLPLVTRDGRGRWGFHFDIDATIDFIRQEHYFPTRPPVYVRLGLSPEALPAAVRKGILIAFGASRTALRRLGRHRAFPSVYKDVSVDGWRLLVRRIVENADPAPEPRPLWPEGKSHAVVLNHDVDTEWGLTDPNGIAAFRAIEEDLGLRSAWLAVARLHEAARPVLADLKRSGHEIGCHGTVHDHAMAYLPVAGIRDRLEGARAFLDEFECKGFRSPSYHRSPALYAGLDGVLAYDMSMHDCFENDNSPVPSFEGCSTCFPFAIAGTGVLEIPTTVAEDLVLELAGQSPEQALETQTALVGAIAGRGGVANILTHPEPMLSSRPAWIACYRRLLERIAGDPSAWFALPREVCAWWRQREAEINAAWVGRGLPPAPDRGGAPDPSGFP